MKDFIAEDNTTSEESTEQDTSISVNSTTDKNTNPDGIHSLLHALFKKIPKSKNKVNKTSTSAKKLVVHGFSCYFVSDHITCSTSKVDKVWNH